MITLAIELSTDFAVSFWIIECSHQRLTILPFSVVWHLFIPACTMHLINITVEIFDLQTLYYHAR